MADSGILFPLILGVTMQQMLITTPLRDLYTISPSIVDLHYRAGGDVVFLVQFWEGGIYCIRP